jgi:hypothetical protein
MNGSSLHIDKPCPYIPKKKDACGIGFHCKSCNKIVVDFTDKTLAEIEQSITPDTCGIFSFDQIPNQPKMSIARQILFYGLMFVSLIGFNVKPIAAQTTKQEIKAKKIEAKEAKKSVKKQLKSAKQEKKSKKRKRTLFRRRGHIKGKMRTMGCPDF